MKNRMFLFLLLLTSNFGCQSLYGIEKAPALECLRQMDGTLLYDVTDVVGEVISFTDLQTFNTVKCSSKQLKRIADNRDHRPLTIIINNEFGFDTIAAVIKANHSHKITLEIRIDSDQKLSSFFKLLNKEQKTGNIIAVSFSQASITGECLQNLPTSIEMLDLFGCEKLEETQLSIAFPRLTNLKKIILEQTSIKGTCLQFLSPTVQKLGIAACDNLEVIHLCTAFPKLTALKKNIS